MLLTVGLAHYDPEAAAREVAAAHAALGPLSRGRRDRQRARQLRDARVAQPALGGRRSISARSPPTGARSPASPRACRSSARTCRARGVFERWAAPFAAAAAARPLLTGHHYPLGCHDVVAPIDRAPALPGGAARRGRRARPLRVAGRRNGRPLPPRRDGQRVLRRAARRQRHVRVRALGARHLRARDDDGDRRDQLRGKRLALRHLHADLRAHHGPAAERPPQSPAGVVRPAAAALPRRRAPAAGCASPPPSRTSTSPRCSPRTVACISSPSTTPALQAARRSCA